MTSMTGHGRGEARTKGWTAVVECHSVNRKMAEVVFHADRDATWLEPAVRERVLESISRGRVQVNLHLERTEAVGGGFFDEKRAAAFVEEARRLQKKLGLEGGITLADVLGAPGVVREAEPGGDDAREPVMKALGLALEGLESTRRREGDALRKALLRGVGKLESLAKKIAPHARRVAADHRASLLKRIEKADLPVRLDDARLATEVALFAERCDITEELERAASHISQFRGKLDAAGPVGRTLEFLVQELGREFNTIGSKSSSSAIAGFVIEAKAELDRIREQLANIE